jgi:hypothetical protein
MSHTSATRLRKGPLETDDFYFSFEGDQLGDDVIVDYDLTIETGLTADTDSQLGDDLVVVRLSGGTEGTIYTIECVATTDSGRVLSQRRYVAIKTP